MISSSSLSLKGLKRYSRVAALTAVALTVTAASAGPLFYLPNGQGGWNAYEFESGTTTLSTAFSTASSRTFPGSGVVGPNAGVTGSVVTVRNSAQNTLLDTVRGVNFGGNSMWLGLSDDPTLVPGAIEGGNTSGNPLPAAGQVPVLGERGYGFRWQSGAAFTYQNWGGGEPNNFGAGENGVEMVAGGTWNDNGPPAQPALTRSYIVEYNLNLAARPGFLSGTPGGVGTFGVDIRRGIGTLNSIRDLDTTTRNNTGTVTSAVVTTINFKDPDAAGGEARFGSASRAVFPGDTPGTDDNDFSLVAHGIIRITVEGDYTFGFSGDDGSSLRINGANFISKSGGGMAAGDTLQFDSPTGDSNTLGVTHLTPGDYPLEFTFFERGGGAFVELYAGQGVITDRSSSSLFLIGSPGGLQLVPEPGSMALLGLTAAGLLNRRRRKA